MAHKKLKIQFTYIFLFNKGNVNNFVVERKEIFWLNLMNTRNTDSEINVDKYKIPVFKNIFTKIA